MLSEDLQNIKKSNSQNENCTATLAYFSTYKLGLVMKPKLSFLNMTQVTMPPTYTLINLTYTTATGSTETINFALILCNATFHPIKQILSRFSY
jgi:hypothetical protein